MNHEGEETKSGPWNNKITFFLRKMKVFSSVVIPSCVLQAPE